jgi:hypothetical protein
VRCYPALKWHLLITQASHLFLARQTQWLRGKNAEITLPQVHAATNALIQSHPLPTDACHCRLARTAATLHYWHRRNAQARASHAKTRCEVLRDLGYHVDKLPRCAPG